MCTWTAFTSINTFTYKTCSHNFCCCYCQIYYTYTTYYRLYIYEIHLSCVVFMLLLFCFFLSSRWLHLKANYSRANVSHAASQCGSQKQTALVGIICHKLLLYKHRYIYLVYSIDTYLSSCIHIFFINMYIKLCPSPLFALDYSHLGIFF